LLSNRKVRKTPYCKHCGAKLPEDARFCPACGTPVTAAETKPLETKQTLKVTGKPKVSVTNTAPGSIDVKSGTIGEVTMEFDFKVPEDLDWHVSQNGDIITVTCRPKVSPFLSWPMYIFSGGPRAKISVTTPQEADVTLETHLGAISVTGMKGQVVAESSVGSVHLQDCEGSVRAETRTGSVKLLNVNGTVYARNATGSIDYSGALSEGENWFKTSTGNVDLNLKGQPDLTVQASTRLGRITCSPELTDARYDRGQYTGRIGIGNGRLFIETKTGNITISQ
jgi:ribosomal protein L40E